MKKIITLAAIIATIVAAFSVIAAPAQAASGCVTKREFNRVPGQANVNKVARIFGTRGEVVSSKTESMTVQGIAYNEAGELYFTQTPYTRTVFTVSYDKCSRWGKRANVVAHFEPWWTPADHVATSADSYATWMQWMRA
jgi:hypothetical protein